MYFDDRTLCLSAGWYTDDILFTTKMAMSFKDCYKNVIYTIFDWTNWVGPTAKWIDKCDSSNDEDITLNEYNPVKEATSGYFYGDGLKANCYPGVLFEPNTLHGEIMHYLITYILKATTQETS